MRFSVRLFSAAAGGGGGGKGILFIDTETSGLDSPRLLQLGWQRRDPNTGQILNAYTSLIRPEPPEFSINKFAQEVHGITMEKVIRNGQDIRFVLSHLKRDLMESDLVIAHNMSFDDRVMQGTLAMVDDEFLTSLWNEKAKLCTMKMALSFPHFPRKPSLGTAFETLTGKKPLAGAHSADIDVEMCAICYFEMMKLMKDKEIVKLLRRK